MEYSYPFTLDHSSECNKTTTSICSSVQPTKPKSTMTSSFFTFIMVYLTLDVSYSWTTHTAGNMVGVTYAGNGHYEIGTVCPDNAELGYQCDARNPSGTFLDVNAVRSFCNQIGSSTQYGFGHGVTTSQGCGECAQLRVLRTDGTYNYMTVMRVDLYSNTMEVGETEIGALLDRSGYQVGDVAPFDYQLVSCPGVSSTGSTGSTGSTPSGSSASTPYPTSRSSRSGRWRSYTEEEPAINSTGKAAIIASCLIVIVIIIVGCFCFYKYKKKKGSANFGDNKENATDNDINIDGNAAGNNDTSNNDTADGGNW